MRGEYFGLIDGKINEFFKGLDVAFTLLIKETLDELLYISH
jgi:hypothetical protein